MKSKVAALCVLSAILLGASGCITPAGQDDISEHRECIYCGMDRKAYGYSRMLIRYEDGSAVGVCSLHCAVIELDTSKGLAVAALLVADRDSRSLLRAEEASWVMGGKKRGVMTQVPKWAFSTKAEALQFIEANGGELATWEEAAKAAREEIAGGQ